MSSQSDGAKEYKKKQIESATPVQLIILLYEGAIEYLNRAEKVAEKKDNDWIEKYHNHLIAAQNIVTELTISLNMEKGGDLAKNLFRLYEYINHKLVTANVEKDAQSISEVKDLLLTLKKGWVGLAEKSAGKQMRIDDTGLNLQG
jgi:flagellar protein FliS